MAVTPVGNPYVESSDLVANYPGASEALAERIDIVGVNPFANAAARDAAIPSPVQGQMCSLNDDNKGYRYDGSAWILFSGAGDANFTNAATGTYTTGGIQYKFLTLTGSGSVTFDQAGFADVLVIGGGGAGGNFQSGGGGAGGNLFITNAYFALGTLTVLVGAGGASVAVVGNEGTPGNNGIASSIGSYYSPGGGGGGAITRQSGGTSNYATPGLNGSSGGGASMTDLGSARNGGAGISGLGNNGGNSAASYGAAGGGGGSGAVGVAGSGNTGGAGGAGSSNSITNAAVTRASGGGGSGVTTGGAGGSGGGGSGVTSGSGVAGSANTGGGGGGGFGGTDAVGGAGGSGLVIVRVVV